MKDEKDKLGMALSDRIGQGEPQRGDCPDAGIIAAAAEGNLDETEKDRVFKHLSLCEDCYETFLMTVELQKEPRLERAEVEEKIVRFKYFRPLAIAASLIIVVLSVYVFYESGPVSEKPSKIVLMEKQKAEKKSIPAAQPPREENFDDEVADEVKVEEEETRKEKKSLPRGEGKVDKSPGAGYLKQKSVPAPVKPAPEKVTQNKEMFQKKMEAEEEIPEQAPPTPEPKAMLTETAQSIPTETKDQTRQQDKRLRATPVLSKSEKRYSKRQYDMEQSAAPSLNLSKGGPMYQQQQAVLLNRQLQQLPQKYFTSEELEKHFSTTLSLSRLMKKELQVLIGQTGKGGRFDQMSVYVRDVKPLITVKTTNQTVQVIPNIDWFLTRSQPGSVEYRFFQLARSGWCDHTGECFGRIDNNDTSLKQRWQELLPHLKEPFKTIAETTLKQFR